MISRLSRRTKIIVIAAVAVGGLAMGCMLDTPPGPRIDEDHLARASGVALVRVTSIERVEVNSVSPGHVEDRISLEVIKSSGIVRESFAIIVSREPGMMPPPRPDAPPPPPPVRRPVEPGDLIAGQRYWLVFGFEYPGSWQRSSVIAWQNAGVFGDSFSKPAKAVRDDRFQWWRMSFPAMGLTLEHLVEPDRASWTVRVIDQGEILWSRALHGRPCERIQWSRWSEPGERRYNPMMRMTSPTGRPLAGTYTGDDVPGGIAVLLASSRGKFTADPEAGLAAGEYLVAQVFDARNGRLLSRRVQSVSRRGGMVLNIRTYDPATGQQVQLTIHQRREAGGKDVGAEDDRWFRHEVRRYDAKTGGHIDTKVYRQGARHYLDEWVEIDE